MGSENLLIGGARLFFNNGGGFRDLGNMPSMSLTRAIKELEHFTASSGSRVLDKKLITETKIGIKFKLDEFNSENLNLLFYGDGITDASYAAGSVTDEALIAYKDRYIFTAKGGISAIVITNSAGTTTYIEGTDYTIDDAAIGAIKILSTGAITNGQAILVDYSYAASTAKKIKAAQNFIVEGSARLRFNASSGSPFTWIIPKAALKVEGDTSLSAENWSDADFTLDVLADSTAAEPSGYIVVG